MRRACMVAYASYSTDARIKNYAQALLKQGYEVDVFALGRPEPCRSRLRVHCLMPKVWSTSILPYAFSQLWFLFLVALRVTVSFAGRRYEFVHVHNMPDLLVLAALVPKLFGARIILDVHDTMPEAYATKFDLPLSHPLIGLIRLEETISAALADRVFTTNELHREALVGHGIPADKITVIMNVGNQTIFKPQHKIAPRDGLTLVYHGTIAERLGPDLILEAIRVVRPVCPGLRLMLIGDGDFMPSIKRLVAEYDLGDVVSLTGWLAVEQLPHYLAQADVGVVGNRRYTEERQNWMLPVKMLEYAAMEIPAIAPRLRVIEHYFDGRSAILYEPDSVEDLARCIRAVYAQPSRLHALRSGLRSFNSKYNWAAMEKRYLESVASFASEA